MSREITADNIDRIVLDLKDDLKVERLSAEDDTIDQLVALAVAGLDNDDDEELIREMKRAFERIEGIAGDYS